MSCFRLSNQVTLSRPVRSTLAKSLSKLNPAESIAKLKDAGRKVRERLQRPTLERSFDPDPLFLDSESEAQDPSTQMRSPVLVASPRTSLRRSAASSNVHARPIQDSGSNSDEPLTGSDAESQLPPISEGVMLQAPAPLYRRHVNDEHSGAFRQESPQQIQHTYQAPTSPFASSYSTSDISTAGDLSPGVLSNQPILGQTESSNLAGASRASADRPWVPSRLSNSSQLPPNGLSSKDQIPVGTSAGFEQVLQTSDMPSLPVGLSSQQLLPPNGELHEQQAYSSRLYDVSLPVRSDLSSERQLPPTMTHTVAFNQTQAPSVAFADTRQALSPEVLHGLQPPPNAVAAAQQLSAGLRQQPVARPSPPRPSDRTYSSDKQLGRVVGRRTASEQQLGRFSATPILGRAASGQAPILEHSSGSRKFSRQKSGACAVSVLHIKNVTGF